jgi:cyclophilin family peptidyl-prolyl cis-trans isomerase
MVVVTVAGKLNDASFQQAKKAVEFLAAAEPSLVANVVSLLPIDYDLLVQRMLPDAFPSVTKHAGPVLCYRGDPEDPETSAYIGGVDALLSWCREEYTYEDATHKIFYERLAKTHMRNVVAKTRREYCAVDIEVDGRTEGTLLVELFTDIAPTTCANFKAFVLGTNCAAEDDEPKRRKKYEGCPVHRVVRDGWFQTGDVLDGDGRGVTSSFGEGATFADETFEVKHDAPGVLSMVSGRKHGNGCQFLIAQEPLTFLDGRRVAFGRVVDGLRVMKLVNREEVTFAERPVREVRVGKCEMVTFAFETKNESILAEPEE